MPKRKKTKELTVFSRNSYKGRLKGVLPAFLPNRCNDLTLGEHKAIAQIHTALKLLINAMEHK